MWWRGQGGAAGMSLRCQRDLCVVMSTLLLSWGCSGVPWIEALNNRRAVSVLEAAIGDLRAVREILFHPSLPASDALLVTLGIPWWRRW